MAMVRVTAMTSVMDTTIQNVGFWKREKSKFIAAPFGKKSYPEYISAKQLPLPQLSGQQRCELFVKSLANRRFGQADHRQGQQAIGQMDFNGNSGRIHAQSGRGCGRWGGTWLFLEL